MDVNDEKFAKVDIIVRVNGKEVATQVSYVKRQPAALYQDVAVSVLKLSCCNAITGMVVREPSFVVRSFTS